jgi:hypothetical protein
MTLPKDPSPMSTRGLRPRRPRTDLGTVVLHWLAVSAIAVAGATGLAIAADAPGRAWLGALRPILPGGDVWTWHLGAGLALTGLAVAYPVYLRRSGLSGRIRLDRARLAAVLGPPQARWAAVNVLLAWTVLVALAIQLVTGGLMYLGRGGWLVSVHHATAWLVLGFPVVHALAHAAYGGSQQLLRILRPTRVLPSAPEADLAELIRRHLEQTAQRERPPGGETLRVHPLTTAAAAALAAVTVVSAVDVGGRDTLSIPSVPRADAPRLDGDLADPVWRRARPVVVDTSQGANLGGTGASRVTIRAVHDGTWAYLAIVWDDPTRSLKHLPLVKRADGWHLLHARYDIEDEDDYYEDKLAVMLAASSAMPAAGSFHLGARPLPDKPPALSARGLHFTTDGSVVDVWHWKATRGGLLGWMDDNSFGPRAEPKEAEVAGRSRYKAGYRTDPGRALFANNFEHQPPGGYRGPLRPKRLPKDAAALSQAMGPFNPDPDASEGETGRGWMTAEESEPYSAEADARIPVGTVIPGVVVAGAYEGDRADVRCAARWASGRWTLEIARRLDTGSAHDVPIRSGVALWVAVFDHTQTRHTRHLRPVMLEVAP